MRCNITLLLWWFHWHWCLYHMMLTPSSMAPLHLLGQDNQDEVQHDCFGHVMPLISTSILCDVYGIVNGITAFLRSRQSKWGVTWLFGSCETTGTDISITWWWQCHQWHNCISYKNMIEMVQQDVFGHMMPLAQVFASHDADSIINGTIVFLRTRWSKWSQTWLLVMGCHWSQHQCHMIMRASSVAPLHSLGQDDQSDVQYDYLVM